MFKFEPIHLQIVHAKMIDAGHKVSMRSLYRWVDSQDSCQPRLATALVLTEILSELLQVEQLDVLYRLCRMEES